MPIKSRVLANERAALNAEGGSTSPSALAVRTEETLQGSAGNAPMQSEGAEEQVQPLLENDTRVGYGLAGLLRIQD